MSISSLAALCGAMIMLAAIPSPSVFLVVARSIASGFLQGMAIALGILLGDIVFILLALYGLSAIAEFLDSILIPISYLGALYLTILGIALWRDKGHSVDVDARLETSWIANFVCGFLITIGDPKAILFYISFFPAFIDVSTLSVWYTGLILAIAAVAIGGVKLVYAYLGHQSRYLFKSPQALMLINRVAGLTMIATGLVLVVKTLDRA